MPIYTQVPIPALADADATANWIHTNESSRLLFAGIYPQDGNPNQNVVYFASSDTDLTHLPLVFEQILPGASPGPQVDARIAQGWIPMKNYWNLNIPGGQATVMAYRVPPQPDSNLGIVVQPDGYIHTLATVFGLDMDGSRDSLDNGEGAPVLGDGSHGIPTANKEVRGAAVPQSLLIAQFGSLRNARGKFVEVIHAVSGATVQPVQIVDIGPHPSRVLAGIALDLTWRVQTELNGNGKIAVKYRFI